MKNLITVLLMLCAGFASAQTGRVSGQITDPASGETLPGVTIVIGSLNTVTDINGTFVLQAVPEGEHTVVFKTIGYSETSMRVKIKTGEELKLQVKMNESTAALNEVVVEGVARKESYTAMMLLQKNSITVSDGIAGDAIRKSTDKSTGDVLKRISGTTIQNNKFVVIRGLNERYNAAFLDGIPLPSSESDKKAFAFDIFPAAMLESITVTKSASPDMTSDFSGGVIRINTKTIPDSAITSVSFSQGFTSGSTFRPYYTAQGGKTDFLGIDDGSRALPSDLAPTTEARSFNNIEKAEQARLMKNDWAITQKAIAPASLGFQLTHGNSWKFRSVRFGVVAGLSYSASNRYTTSVRREFDASVESEDPLQQFELNDDDYTQNILGGLFINTAIKFGKNHSINFRNMITENSEDKVVLRTGFRDFDQDLQTEEKSSVRSFTENQFLMNLLSGESVFPKAGLTFTWNAGRGVVDREIPSLKRMVYTRAYNKNQSDATAPFEASIPTSGTSPSSGGNIFYSKNHEEIRSVSADLSKQFRLPFGMLMLKGGAWYQERDRDFGSRQYGYSRYSQGSRIVFDKSLLYLPDDKIFDEQNLGIIQPYIPAGPGQPAVKGVGGFKLEETTKLNDAYTAGSELKAGYLMQEFKVREIIRLSGGARLENYRQFLMSFEDDGDTVNIDTTYHDFLPSGNLVISPTSKINLRFSYGQTVSRPEFRELAPFGFFDFSSFYSVRGNPALKRALVHNYDFRFEYFARKNQMISATVFYKKYLDPIEQINRVDVSREVYFANVDQGINYGAELEFRVGLASLLKDESTSKWNNLYLNSNLAHIKSEVRVDSIQGALSSVRSLQGQSPYVVNVGLTYDDQEKGWSASFQANQVGRRLAIVGNTQEPDTYEHSRLVLDCVIEKKFRNRMNIKGAVRDMLAQETIFYQDENMNGKMDIEADNILSQSKYGATYTISIGYSF